MMEEEFTSAIQRCGLPLKLDEATEGDGNCWVRAVVQQLERPEMRQQLNDRTREILKARKVRKAPGIEIKSIRVCNNIKAPKYP